MVDGRLSRLRVAADNTLVGGEVVLIENRWCQQYPSHSVGDLAFGETELGEHLARVLAAWPGRVDEVAGDVGIGIDLWVGQRGEEGIVVHAHSRLAADHGIVDFGKEGAGHPGRLAAFR